MTWDEVKRACSKVIGPCPECGGKLTISLKIPRVEPGCKCDDHWGTIGMYCCHGATTKEESEAMGYTKENREYMDMHYFAFGRVAPPESEIMDMAIKAATVLGGKL